MVAQLLYTQTVVGSNPTFPIRIMNTYYISMIALAAIVYILWQDPNVPKFVELITQLARIKVITFFMKIKMKRQLDKDYNDMQKAMKEWLKENGKDQM